MNQVLSISSFDNKDIKNYARKFFAYENIRDEGVVDAFFKEVTRGHVNQLAREPLTLLFLCLVWPIGRNHLPKIRTQLYHDLLVVLRKRYNNKGGCEMSEQDWDNLLLILGELAFKKLTEKKGGVLVFKKEDINKHASNTADTACDVGLLTKADPPQKEPDSEYNFQSVINKYDKFYQFAHLSLQECLAAKYLYNTFDNEVSNDNLQKIRQHDIRQFENLIHFVCGYVSLFTKVNDEKLNMINALTTAVLKTVGFYRLDNTHQRMESEFWEETGRNPLQFA